MNFATLTFSLLLTIPILSLAATDYLKKDAPFTEARALLIKDKWKPVRLHLQDHYVYEGVEKELFRHKFIEVDTCSMDTSRCILFYKKNDRCLRLDTIGEQLKAMKVVQWSEECPGSPPKRSIKTTAN